MFQGKLTWDYKSDPVSVRLWSSFLVQPQQGTVVAGVQTKRSQVVEAVDVGAKADIGPFGLVGYYYWGSGVGTTALFYNGFSPTGQKRNSEGYYVQGSWKPIPKLKLVASYGESSLYRAEGEFNPFLVRRNEAWIGAAYYSLTEWLTLVGEYAHVASHSHGGTEANENTFSAGGIVFF
jgi:predicted porin